MTAAHGADDAALAIAVAGGDTTALAAVYDRYAVRLLGFCRSMLHNATEAEDCLQDVFVIAATRLGGLRDAFTQPGSSGASPLFHVVAPCTHQRACPMFAEGNERHWCHFFAPPPSEIFANPDWVKFGQRAGIDLRSLAYSFVALQRSVPSPSAGDTDLSRIIGRPEHFKPYARFLNCDATGLAELTLPKRANPALFKELDRTKAPLVYRWQRDGEKVTDGQPLDH